TLPAVGREVHLPTYLHVREDALQLFGFTDEAERSLFENLISVSGIGPRLATGILSGATAGRVREGIEAGDAEFLTTLPGVGKKLAQRLLVELREKFAPGSLTKVPISSGTPGALQIAMKAERCRGEALHHHLFHGPPGLGKTTLASIIAHEMGVSIVQTSGPVLERAADLAGLLTNLEERAVLFIDEIHRMNPVVEEYLYPAIEDFRLDIMIDRGPSARSVRIDLKRFSLIGATTRTGLLSAPLRGRFGMTARLDYYSTEELARIITLSAKLFGGPVDEAGARELA